MNKISILCIDDDPVIQTLVREVLAPWHVDSCFDLQSANIFLKQKDKIDAIIVDIDLPDGDGLRFLSLELQKFKELNVPIFIISGHTDISKKLMAFQFGVDDFLTKPFDPLEFKIRLESRLRKSKTSAQEIKKIGDVILNHHQYKAFHCQLDGSEQDLMLTMLEMKILVFLTTKLENIFTRNQIIDSIWGNVAITDRTVDSHVAHLRKKLKDTKIKIKTAQNIGYSAHCLD